MTIPLCQHTRARFVLLSLTATIVAAHKRDGT
jgi:hypothetical protein